MKAEPRCIPCFLDQAVEAMKMIGADHDTQVRTMKRLLAYLDGLSVDGTLLTVSPPELSMRIHAIIREETGNPDPYSGVKQLSTETVLKLLPHLNQLMEQAEDRLALAVKLGALGNVIDFGTPSRLDINELVNDVVERDLTVFDLDLFKQTLEKPTTRTILFLGDNAGEIILDTFLLRELKALDKQIIYGVREGPIINDATHEDAVDAGIPDFAKLITTGSHGPGTLLNISTPALDDALANADLVISKGQGNFESLSADPLLKEKLKIDSPVFFLLTVKCGIVGAYAGVAEGSTIFRAYYPHR